MRSGIRLQLVLALGGLMALVFLPLFLAVASLTHATLRSVRTSNARSLGRAVAAHVVEARAHRSDQDLQLLLEAEIGSVGLDAIAVYSADGRRVAQAGVHSSVDTLPQQVPVETERTQLVGSSQARLLHVLVPGYQGSVLAVVRVDDDAQQARPLLRLVAAYTVVFAITLLVFIYLALTRMLVGPIDELSQAARRVSDGARSLEIPTTGPREIAQLGASFADMTGRLRAEEEALRKKVAELQQATDELKAAHSTLVSSERLASVGRLAAGLAHEIGNPISAILGFEDLLLTGGLEPEEQSDFLQRMKNETERISRVLRQLLDFARPAASPGTAEKQEPGSAADAIHDVSVLLLPHKAFQKVELSIDIEQDLPMVTLSRSQMVQVLLNLLLNAADAMGQQGQVKVTARECSAGVRVEVQDTGPGIREDVKDKLFEPFVTTKDIGVGTGLGLAICRGLVEAAGGTIAVDDAPGGGARFAIELPKAPTS